MTISSPASTRRTSSESRVFASLKGTGSSIAGASLAEWVDLVDYARDPDASAARWQLAERALTRSCGGDPEVSDRVRREGWTIPVVDLLLAALAERHRLVLLHYDHDFDRLRKATALDFESEWLASPGSL